MAKIIVLKGREEGSEINLPQGNYKIGRHKSNDFVINDPSVSRNHVIVKWGFGGYAVIDLSLNGTKVNKKKIGEAVLSDGDEIEIGGTLLKFCLEEKDDDIGKKGQNSGVAAVSPRPSPAVKTGTTIWPVLVGIAGVVALACFTFTDGKKRAYSSSQPDQLPEMSVQLPAGHSQDAAFCAKIGDRLYRERKIRDGNLYTAIQWWKKAVELKDGASSQAARMSAEKLDNAQKELDLQVRDGMFCAYQSYYLGDAENSCRHLERIIRIIPDPSDQRYRSAAAKLKAVRNL